MKRSNPSTGRKTHVPSDFKRIKAKVGKRAPKKLNATDTTFETAQVSVRSQNISPNTSIGNKNQLVSSKGKEVSQLIISLNHPSATVRVSSLQGIRDAITSASVETVVTNLPLLIPSLSKCLVDDDSKARNLGIGLLFHDIVPRVLSSSDTAYLMMRPFLPLITAYITSALHSLDEHIRYDSCVALHLVSTRLRLAATLEDNGNRGSCLDATLPAFAILLDDVSGGIASISQRGSSNLSSVGLSQKKKSNSSTKNKGRGNDRTKVKGILRSFIATLQIAMPEDDASPDDAINKSAESEGNTFDETMQGYVCTNRTAVNGMSLSLQPLKSADLAYSVGGSSLNAIIRTKQVERHHYTSLNGIQDLIDKTLEAAQNLRSRVLSIKSQSDLLCKLRNLLVEIIQRGQSKTSSGLHLSLGHVEELSLVLKALRLLWNGHCRYELSRDEEMVEEESIEMKKLLSTGVAVQALLLESMPVYDDSGNPANRMQYMSLNASLSTSLIDFGTCICYTENGKNRNKNVTKNAENSSTDSSWVEAIFSYLLPRLSSPILGNDEAKQSQQSTTEDEVNMSNTMNNTLLSVIGKLLLKKSATKDSFDSLYLLRDMSKRFELLTKFGHAFFTNTTELKDNGSFCSSSEGRSAVILLLCIIKQFSFSKGNGAGEQGDAKFVLEILAMAKALPIYLQHWQGSYPKESGMVISSLISIVRGNEMSVSTQGESSGHSNENDIIYEKAMTDFSSSLRNDLSVLFQMGLKRSGVYITIFEALPESTQRLAISLLAQLRYPSESLISSLAKVCARSRLSNSMSDYIMDAIFNIRRDSSTTAYFTFLLTSTGIMEAHITFRKALLQRQVEEEKESLVGNSNLIQLADIKCMLSYDTSLARLCHFLVQSGSKKSLQILRPTLMSWICNEDEEMSQQDCSTKHIQHKALALSRLLKCRTSLAILSCCILDRYQSTNANDADLDLDMEKIGSAICRMFLAMLVRDYYDASVTQMIAPLVTFFVVSPTALRFSLDSVTKAMKLSQKEFNDKNECLVNSVLMLLQHKQLHATFRKEDVSKALLNAVAEIERQASSGPLDLLVDQVKTETHILLGHTLEVNI